MPRAGHTGATSKIKVKRTFLPGLATENRHYFHLGDLGSKRTRLVNDTEMGTLEPGSPQRPMHTAQLRHCRTELGLTSTHWALSARLIAAVRCTGREKYDHLKFLFIAF